ncbi:hypothetical protein HYPSUDRAFT_200291 [Hypholoma sublateritium FD-334 SS-4]|uniref:Uncharacterized protein n=1 Tax=Hypholoma sublateritium (strain FD-334 SS-4) TaxID=945553 RepID=A0A0D2P7Y1_HYPSF|nr:hypothetical protein HYPSUDRAFT_200291 [Hypholoma sublateritium FD-334 SS-4]
MRRAAGIGHGTSSASVAGAAVHGGRSHLARTANRDLAMDWETRMARGDWCTPTTERDASSVPLNFRHQLVQEQAHGVRPSRYTVAARAIETVLARILLVAYPTGLQMWDCADLSALREVLDLDLGAAEWALMLGGAETRGEAEGPCRPCGRASMERGAEKGALKEARPLLGML